MEGWGFALACSTLLCPHMTGPCNHKGSSSWKSGVFCKWLQTDTPSTQQCLLPHSDTKRGDHRAVLHLRSRHYHSFCTVAEDRLGFPSSCRDTGRLHQLQKLKIELGAWWQQIRTTTGMRIYQCITLFSRGLWLKHIAKKALLDKKWHLWGHIQSNDWAQEKTRRGLLATARKRIWT